MAVRVKRSRKSSRQRSTDTLCLLTCGLATKGGLSVAKSQDKHDVRGDGFFDGLLVGLRALTSDNRSWRVAHMNEWWPEDVQTLAAAHAPVY